METTNLPMAIAVHLIYSLFGHSRRFLPLSGGLFPLVITMLYLINYENVSILEVKMASVDMFQLLAARVIFVLL